MISTNITGAAAYAAIQGAAPTDDSETASTGSASFGSVLQNAMTGLNNLGQNADTKTTRALSGTGSLTDVVMAVSKAEMALQASVAVRDKMISAYQDIMRMAV